MDKPKQSDMIEPWAAVDCGCAGSCNKCDGFGWFYFNKKTKASLSELMRDALERHG